MFKYLIVAAAIFGLGLCAASAEEMSLPGAIPSSASAETDSAMGGARDDATFGSAMHAASERGADTTRPRAQPDIVNETRTTDAARAPLGVDVSGGDAAHRHPHTHWQSLLPGVMK